MLLSLVPVEISKVIEIGVALLAILTSQYVGFVEMADQGILGGVLAPAILAAVLYFLLHFLNTIIK